MVYLQELLDFAFGTSLADHLPTLLVRPGDGRGFNYSTCSDSERLNTPGWAYQAYEILFRELVTEGYTWQVRTRVSFFDRDRLLFVNRNPIKKYMLRIGTLGRKPTTLLDDRIMCQTSNADLDTRQPGNHSRNLDLELDRDNEIPTPSTPMSKRRFDLSGKFVRMRGFVVDDLGRVVSAFKLRAGWWSSGPVLVRCEDEAGKIADVDIDCEQDDFRRSSTERHHGYRHRSGELPTYGVVSLEFWTSTLVLRRQSRTKARDSEESPEIKGDTMREMLLQKTQDEVMRPWEIYRDRTAQGSDPLHMF
jgi:hypothetical protein